MEQVQKGIIEREIEILIETLSKVALNKTEAYAINAALEKIKSVADKYEKLENNKQ